MKRTPVDILVQLAFLEGRVTTRGLYEKTVLARKSPTPASSGARQKLLARLQATLEEQQDAQKPPLTIGSFLKIVRTGNFWDPHETPDKVGLTVNVYRMLEEDRISPLRISVDSWKKFRTVFDLSMETFQEMIRRTHQLVFFQASFKTTLGRYKGKKGKGRKSQELTSAARELYVRARLSLPREEERKLSDLLRAIEK